MLKPAYPYYLANKAVYANKNLAVTNKYTNETASYVAMADEQTIDQAITAAVNAQEKLTKMAPFERQAILNHCIGRFEERFEPSLQRLDQ